MNHTATHHPHSHHHLLPAAIAGSAALIAAAVLAGPVQLPFGGDEPAAPAIHQVAPGAAAGVALGRCISSTHPAPADVPAPVCRHVNAHTRAASAADVPAPCFRRFRSWSEDVARPMGCD